MLLCFNNLFSNQVEYLVNDRMSFMRFLGLSIADDFPDNKTVWNFRKNKINQGLKEPMVELFWKELEQLGLHVTEGKIAGASFVEALRRQKASNTKISFFPR